MSVCPFFFHYILHTGCFFPLRVLLLLLLRRRRLFLMMMFISSSDYFERNFFLFVSSFSLTLEQTYFECR